MPDFSVRFALCEQIRAVENGLKSHCFTSVFFILHQIIAVFHIVSGTGEKGGLGDIIRIVLLLN